MPKDKDKVLEAQQAEIQEPVYSREELIQAAFSFGVKPEVMAGALRLANKDSLTKFEAEKAIKSFLERKV